MQLIKVWAKTRIYIANFKSNFFVLYQDAFESQEINEWQCSFVGYALLIKQNQEILLQRIK